MISILSPVANTSALGEFFAMLRRHRTLLLELTKRDLTERYAGQVFGVIWTVGHPLALMGIYAFVFTQVFKAGVTEGMKLDYTTYILSGLVPWLACSDALGRGCVAVTSQANLVKQVVFPIEVLPLRSALVALATQVIMTGLLVLYTLATAHIVQWTLILLPYVLLVQAMALGGICLILASVSVYFRDLKDFVQVFTTANMFLMPVMYLPSSAPGMFAPILYLNPFSHLIWMYQDVCYFGEIRHPFAWVVFTLFAVFTLSFGYRTFRRLKTMFGNVL